jgi:hypothetical protein
MWLSCDVNIKGKFNTDRVDIVPTTVRSKATLYNAKNPTTTLFTDQQNPAL